MKLVLLLVLLATSTPAFAQDPVTRWMAASEPGVRVVPDVTYLTASNWEAKLDLYLVREDGSPAGDQRARPTVIFIHGGGWVNGVKEGSVMSLMPYLAMGMHVVNVEYRLARIAHAPAAVEDCRCALRWVIRNAKTYGIDTSRLVVAGHSAGGHLALMTGLLPESAGLDRQCPGPEEPAVAAIVNWYGITDVNGLLEGPDLRAFAVTWLGSTPDRERIATRVSPLTYVRPGVPPVFTIHGDEDQTVPYSHAVRLHEALDAAHVPNELVTTPGGRHGYACCTLDQRIDVYERMRRFFVRHGVLR
jgi:acetyl esterase/lipase